MNNEYVFPESELIINADGSIFHLHVKPAQLADKVILVGDPGRVNLVASHFDTKECEVSNREFHTITGTYKGKRITCLSTGIGCDNIDFSTRKEKTTHRTLSLVRVGTCGGLQPNTPTGTFIASVKSIGFDGLLNFYAGRDEASDMELEAAFKQHVGWTEKMGNPYVATACPELIDRIAKNDMVRGITIACGGFFGPQGRRLRLPLMDPKLNEKIESFDYNGLKICNFEMESSALAGLSTLMGHKAMTCCMVIANRRALKAEVNYKNDINDLIELVLERI